MPTPRQLGHTPTPPEADPVTTVERELVTLSRRLRNGARTIYEESGLTFVEYSLIALVAEHSGITAKELADSARIDKSTASRQLARLRERGLIRRADAASPGGMALEITDTAQRTLTEIRRRTEGALSRRVADWPADQIETFASLLRQFNATLPDAPDE